MAYEEIEEATTLMMTDFSAWESVLKHQPSILSPKYLKKSTFL